MAVASVPTNNISFGDFDSWSTEFSGNSNINLDTLLANFSPAYTRPHSISDIRSDGIIYGQVQVDTGGSVAIAGAYSQTLSAGTTTDLNNVNGSETSITLTATAVYPYTFARWRSGGSGGSEISTSSAITLNASNFTSVTLFYCEFTTTHSSP